MKKIIKFSAIFLSIIKSFFVSVTQVAWGLISLFGLNALIAFLVKDSGFDLTPINNLFLQMEMFITTHIMFFVICFFFLDLYFNIKEVLK